MSVRNRLILGVVVWVAAVTLLHLWLNGPVFDTGPRTTGRFHIGFLPVT